MAYEDRKKKDESLGLSVGRGLRTGLNTAIGAGKALANTGAAAVEGGINAATLPYRQIGGMARDVQSGFTGTADPNAGKPTAGISVPRPFGRAMPAVAVAAAPAAGPVTRKFKPAATAPAPAASAVAAAPNPAAPAPAPLPNRNFNLRPGDVNTFTGSDGVTRAVPGMLDNSAQPAPTAGFQRGLSTPQVQYQPVQAQGTAMGASIAAMTDDQKAQMRQDDFRWAMRGANTRSARQAVADAYVAGEQVRGAERRADIEARSAENIAAGRNATDIARTNAEGQLGAQRINADLANSAADRDNRLEEARITRRLQPTMLEDGTLGQVGDDGTFAPITGQDGKPVRGAQSVRQTGDLTASDLLKSYDTRRAAIETGLADDAVKQQLAALDADPMYASLRGTTQPAGAPALPDKATFMAELKKRNPNATQQQLDAEWKVSGGQ